MAKSNLGQTRPLENTINELNKKLLSPEGTVEGFPHPLSLFSLYSVITQKQKCNSMPDKRFRPFKGCEHLEIDAPWGKHSYWVRILSDLLGGRLLYANSIHRAKLTDFGKFLYPVLMEVFLNLYEQNELLNTHVASWREKYGEDDFKGFSL